MSEGETVEAMVRRTCATMPPTSKRVFLLRAMGRCDFLTIAAIIGTHIDVVERHPKEALLHLDEEIARWGDNPG
jgi:DNA-directed RNA polymerase specialized sigma24 family protein